MKSSLEIKTSFVSPVSLKLFIEKGYLPVFILRSIANSEVIGMYSGSSIHLRELSPSPELFHEKRDGVIDFEEFSKRYIEEISGVNLENIIKKLEYLANLCEARGVVLLGYGSNDKICHRSVLSSVLNESGLLEKKVTELIF